jgi:hypothetical protein
LKNTSTNNAKKVAGELILDEEHEQLKDNNEKELKEIESPKKQLKLDDFINSSTVLQYFAKKLNSYLKDKTYIVKIHALDIGNALV